MIEFQLAQWITIRIGITDFILAFSALGALGVSILIGIRQTKATHAAVNRQIVQSWVDRFRDQVSFLRSIIASIPALYKKSSQEHPSHELRERLEKISYLSDNIILMLNINDEDQYNLQKYIQDMERFALRASANQGTADEWGEISRTLFVLSKTIIDKKNESVIKGELGG